MTLREAFKSYWDHAAVNNPPCQRQAYRAWQVIVPHLTMAERAEVLSARGHSEVERAGNRLARAEFDTVMKKLEQRLFS